MRINLNELYKVTVTEFDFGQRILEEQFFDNRIEADEFAVEINKKPRHADYFIVADVRKIK